MAKFPKKLAQKLQKRRLKNTFRKLPNNLELVDFSSNDYLGLARNEEIVVLANEILQHHAIKENGATGSRLLSGNHILFAELEEKLEHLFRFEAALIFNSGYDANIGFFSSVPQRSDVVFYDELIHASIRDGIQMGNAKSYKFKHNNIEDLRRHIERVTLSLPALSKVEVSKGSRNDFGYEPEIYIVTESVFSMDGDSPNLKELANYCAKNKYHLVVDEAHAIGVFEKGLVNKYDIQDKIFAQIITFGKALGCHGAVILGSNRLKEYLVNFARSFIYTTALPPHAIASILSVFKWFETQEALKRQNELKENISFFKNEVERLNLKKHFLNSDSAIQSAVFEGNENVKKIATALNATGFDVKPILSPTVPKGQERLRFCIHSYNEKTHISGVLTVIKDFLNG